MNRAEKGVQASSNHYAKVPESKPSGKRLPILVSHSDPSKMSQEEPSSSPRASMEEHDRVEEIDPNLIPSRNATTPSPSPFSVKNSQTQTTSVLSKNAKELNAYSMSNFSERWNSQEVNVPETIVNVPVSFQLDQYGMVSGFAMQKLTTQQRITKPQLMSA